MVAQTFDHSAWEVESYEFQASQGLLHNYTLPQKEYVHLNKQTNKKT